jgi:hypothetical protein
MAFRRKWIVLSMLAVTAIAALLAGVRVLTGHSRAGEESRNRWFVCAESRRPFRALIEIGTSVPVKSPYSHKATGYPAELCFWTREGTIKLEPTPVLLNRILDPNDKSPTFCPDCGRLVTAHNPPPEEGHPPPTREEWLTRGGTRVGVENSERSGE